MTPWWEAGARLLLASLLGGVVGWQRESADKPAGFRTHIIVCLGAALFTLISAVGFFGTGADPARVASNIVVGIGFLGAGTIWRSGSSVQGLTTAASLWTVAAIGTATGLGYYFGAAAATLIVIVTLTALKWFEERIPRRGVGTLVMIMADRPGQLGHIGTVLGSFGVNIERVDMAARVDNKVEMEINTRIPARVSRDDILVAMGDLDGVEDVRWADGGSSA